MPPTDAPVKSTKVQESRETALLLTLGFVVSAYLKVDPSLFYGFGAMLIGKTGVFMWGKGKEYQRDVDLATK